MHAMGGFYKDRITGLGFHGEVSWMERPSIKRPGYGEGNLETELTVGFSGEEVVDIPLTIGERKYSREEIQEIFQGILENLEEQILGENKSLEEVRKDLDFADSFGNGTVTAVWSVDPPDQFSDEKDTWSGETECKFRGFCSIEKNGFSIGSRIRTGDDLIFLIRGRDPYLVFA